MEFLLTLGMLAIIGFIVGVGVLLSKEFPKVAEFLNRRPVLGWTAAFVAGGFMVYILAYLAMFLLLLIVSVFVH